MEFGPIDAYWKSRRAEHHLENLRIAINAFVESDSHTETVEEVPAEDITRHTVVFEQPHVNLYLIAGDLLQCLRTALDQAVWWLATVRGGGTSRTQFPIFATRCDETKKRFDASVQGLSNNAIEYIESLQPYNRPTGQRLRHHALWQLHEINRIDKHRRISVRATGASIGSRFEPTVTLIESGYIVTVPYSDKQELRPTIRPMVMFGDDEVTVAIGDIERIYEQVSEEILPRLAGLG